MDLNCTKGNLRWPLIRLLGCVLGIFPQPDTENLIGVRFIVVIDGSVGYEIMKELNFIWLLLCSLDGTNLFGIG